MKSEAGTTTSVIFFITWIVIGNYILLNLFLAILLDGFKNSQDIFESIEQEEEEEIEEDLSANIFDPKKLNKKKSIINSKSINVTLKKKIDEFKNQVCEESLFMFNIHNNVRKTLRKIIKNEFFEFIILIFIIGSSLNLVFDTYVDFQSSEPREVYKKNVSENLHIFFNVMFVTECLLKIISDGFFLCPNSYLRNTWNSMDFIIVLLSVIDMFVEKNLNLPIFKVSIIFNYYNIQLTFIMLDKFFFF